MKSPLARTISAVALTMLLTAKSQCPAAEDKVASREESIKTTLAVLDQELKDHGGSWAAWAEGLKPFRENLDRIRSTTKWPWPATDGFRFEGKETVLLLEDDLGARPEGQNPLKSIVAVSKQLKANGIDLIVMPIPDKLSVYPDFLVKETPKDRNVALPVRRLMKELLENDVEVIDLQSVYQAVRRESDDKTRLYYTTDAHWRNNATQLAAAQIASRLKRYDFVARATAGANPYTTKPHRRTDGAKADDILIVLDSRTDKGYADAADSPIVLTGDSFSMYNQNAAAMGNITAHVAANIHMPLAILCREGLSGEMPLELARLANEKGYLRGRRVLVWTFCSRMLVAAKWPMVELAPAVTTATQPAAKATAATGVVSDMSPGPAKNPPYANYIMKLHVTKLADADGKPIGRGEAVVLVLAMRDRVVLPAASVAKGQQVKLQLVPWGEVERQYGTTMTGTLSDTQLETSGTRYWAPSVGE